MTIEPSQIIIVLAILGFAYYTFGARTVLGDRLIYLALAFGGLVLALYPEFSTRIANAVGVGRGTDLILYIFVLFSLFYFTSLASQLKRVEQQITALTRALAVDQATFRGAPRETSQTASSTDRQPEAPGNPCAQ
jgi:small membrane protein